MSTGTNTHTDVIIVGAGPTGLALACQLARWGVDFVIAGAKAGHAGPSLITMQLFLTRPANAVACKYLHTDRSHAR